MSQRRLDRTLTVAALLAIASVAAAEPPPAAVWRQIVPAVAHVAGADGASWRTDLVLYNPGSVAVAVTTELLPAGDALPAPAATTLVPALGPGMTVVVSDVLADPAPGRERGALVITARGPAGVAAPIVARSRTWTDAGGLGGSFGQGIPAAPWREDGDLSDPERRLTGLVASAVFRVNIGIVNPTETIEETFAIEANDATGAVRGATAVTLGPRRWLQANRLLERMGLEEDGLTVVVRRTGFFDLAPGQPDAVLRPDFVAYASIIDRRTNDPAYLTAQAAVEARGRPRFKLLPAAAHTDGADGSTWATDLAIHYPGDEPIVVLQMELIPSDPAGGGSSAPARAIGRIAPGGTVMIADLMGAKFPDHATGALQVKATSGGSRFEDIQVVSRTWTPDPAGVGTIGQGIPALPYVEGSDPLVVAGLERSMEFRSNLGLVNASANVRLALDVTVLDATGVAVASLTETLQPWVHLQLDDILGQLGLDGAGYTAVVRVTETENLLLRESESWQPVLAAYASVVDRATNDPTYVAAVPLRAAAAPFGEWYDFARHAPWFGCPDEAPPDEATVVTAFDQAWHYFGGGDNTRTIVSEVEFPAAADWNQVGLWLDLECPSSGLCDAWDRTGSLQLVLNPDDPEDQWQYLELMRHITPYRIGMCEYVDLTALAPLLTGRRTLTSWIDTWVGPGHSDGDGWRISWRFVFYPGQSQGASEVVNLWGLRSLEVGNPAPGHTVADQIQPITVTVPEGITRVAARLTTTGHAFGNSDNCAEFCPLRQDLLVNGERRSVLPWRTDCEYNPYSGQQGTWRYDRNGWCPGAIVPGAMLDLTDLLGPSRELTIGLDVRQMDGGEFVNTIIGGTAPFEWLAAQLLYFSE